MQRQREVELRRTLRELRTAIDHYKDAADQGMIAATELKLGNEGYPPDARDAGRGRAAAGDATGPEAEVPAPGPDRSDDELQRSGACGRTRTAPDSRSWGGQNVYDVYTTSDGTALDGTKYRDW